MADFRNRLDALFDGEAGVMPASVTAGLSVLAGIYGGALRAREQLYQGGRLPARQLPAFVLSIGNLTVGGTGKTPLTVYLARLLTGMGYRPAVISRGYKGAAETQGGIVSDGRRLFMGAEAAGDEPFMIARTLEGVPVLVGRDRFRAGCLAWKRFAPDVILLDDGFQHLRLKRNLDLVLLDWSRPLGNGRLLPRGPLREPPAALKRADGVVFTRYRPRVGGTGTRLTQWLLAEEKAVFYARHVPQVVAMVPAGAAGAEAQSLPAGLTGLGGRRVFLFSGIARNPDFRQALADEGCRIAGHETFADHHAYTRDDLDRICRAADRAGADLLATTEKDFARLGADARFPLALAVIGVEISFADGADRFAGFIRGRLEAG